MPCVSSEDFARQWRYAMDKELVATANRSFELPPENLHFWGDEAFKIDLGSPPTDAAISSDGSRLAVTAGERIYVYKARDLTAKPRLLRGHESGVADCVFQPGNSNLLVSYSAGEPRSLDGPEEPTIIFWNLHEQDEHAVPAEISDEQRDQLVKNVATQLFGSLAAIQPSISLSDTDLDSVQKTLTPAVDRFIARSLTASNHKIFGRLTAGQFQSECFSPSGRLLVYLPGTSPRSNDNVPWHIHIHDTQQRQDVVTLVGHTDDIMWTGFSPNEQWFASVSWDETMRLWDTTDWSCKHIIHTDGQNWTGAFSPDSTMFAGTCGSGSLHVHSLETLSAVCHLQWKDWWRCMSWHPDNTRLAVGGRDGVTRLVDVIAGRVIDERIVAMGEEGPGSNKKRFWRGFLEMYGVAFVDGGDKLAVLTSGDGSAEVYDFATGQKHRFARTGTHDPSLMKDEEEAGLSKTDDARFRGTYSMRVWEDQIERCVKIATIDGDVVRIWSLPMAKT